jgi:hypothetical protein
VVFQGAYGRGSCQFSFACDGSMRRGREPGAWNRAQKVAGRALGGYVLASVGNATHFHTVNVAPDWRNRLVRVQQVGLHVFYRFGGSAGSPGAFDGQPRPSGVTGAFDIATASLLPEGPLPYGQLAGIPGSVVLASSVSDPGTAVQGMGGPEGLAPEPASAPAAAAPAKPAVTTTSAQPSTAS